MGRRPCGIGLGWGPGAAGGLPRRRPWTWRVGRRDGSAGSLRAGRGILPWSVREFARRRIPRSASPRRSVAALAATTAAARRCWGAGLRAAHDNRLRANPGVSSADEITLLVTRIATFWRVAIPVAPVALAAAAVAAGIRPGGKQREHKGEWPTHQSPPTPTRCRSPFIPVFLNAGFSHDGGGGRGAANGATRTATHSPVSPRVAKRIGTERIIEDRPAHVTAARRHQGGHKKQPTQNGSGHSNPFSDGLRVFERTYRPMNRQNPANRQNRCLPHLPPFPGYSDTLKSGRARRMDGFAASRPQARPPPSR